MQNDFYFLTINPGSTSTKVSLFKNLECISTKSLSHPAGELEGYSSIIEQYPLRKAAVLDYMAAEKVKPSELNAVVGRGGLLKPLQGGIYLVNELMLEDLKSCRYGQHASNLGAVLAFEIASPLNIPAYVVNPVVVDELEPLARYSGSPEFERKSVFHALNQKAVAERASKESGRSYNELNLIVAHLGGGISVAAHCKGKVIDVNNALEEGPFSPERAGSVPSLQLIELCFSGRYTKEEVRKLIVGKGGLVAYLGTSDCRDAFDRMDAGDKKAGEVMQAMAYQVAREIAASSAVLYGKVDLILLTGGIAHSKRLVQWISERVGFIAPVRVYPGEDEMTALAEGALKVLKGEESAREYI